MAMAMREEIIMVTAQLISEGGPQAASTRAICKALGISAPTLYHYFADKADLLAAVTDLAFMRHYQFTSAVSGDDPVQILRDTWDRYIEFVRCEPSLYQVMVQSLAQRQTPKEGLHCFDSLVQRFKQLEKNGLLRDSPKRSAQVYLASALGISLLLFSQTQPGLPITMISLREGILQMLLRRHDEAI